MLLQYPFQEMSSARATTASSFLVKRAGKGSSLGDFLASHAEKGKLEDEVIQTGAKVVDHVPEDRSEAQVGLATLSTTVRSVPSTFGIRSVRKVTSSALPASGASRSLPGVRQSARERATASLDSPPSDGYAGGVVAVEKSLDDTRVSLLRSGDQSAGGASVGWSASLSIALSRRRRRPRECLAVGGTVGVTGGIDRRLRLLRPDEHAAIRGPSVGTRSSA